jgi:hypothetical protein
MNEAIKNRVDKPESVSCKKNKPRTAPIAKSQSGARPAASIVAGYHRSSEGRDASGRQRHAGSATGHGAAPLTCRTLHVRVPCSTGLGI